MNFVYYFAAPWFIEVLFFCLSLFTLPIKDLRLLRYARNDTERGLAMTVNGSQ